MITLAPHLNERQADKISIRDRLDGRSIDIKKQSDGTWKASLFPVYGEEFCNVSAVANAEDPVAAVQRLVYALKQLPQ